MLFAVLFAGLQPGIGIGFEEDLNVCHPVYHRVAARLWPIDKQVHPRLTVVFAVALRLTTFIDNKNIGIVDGRLRYLIPLVEFTFGHFLL